MQNTLRQSATVIAVSLHFVGYSNVSSSSSVGSAVEVGREGFSPVMGRAASTATPAAGATVSTAPFFSSVTVAWILGAAVFSESVMLEGRRWLFVSLMGKAERGRVVCMRQWEGSSRIMSPRIAKEASNYLLASQCQNASKYNKAEDSLVSTQSSTSVGGRKAQPLYTT
jgi:hypothetical protein